MPRPSTGGNDESSVTPSALNSLAKLSELGAGLLPDPEKQLRQKAAALAEIEADDMAAAFKTAGCANLRKTEDD